MNEMEKGMYSFAYKLVHFAGTKLKQDRENITINIKEKTSHMDIVSKHDLIIEKFLMDAILGKYPDHYILSEESQYLTNNSFQEAELNNKNYTWVIDPIDGTLNFCRFNRDYTISLALYINENPVFGLVYDVANDNLFSATKGEQPEINHCCLGDSPKCQDKLNNAVVAMSLRTMLDFSELGMDVLETLAKAQALRYSGCASLELCRVATGELDFFISSNVYEWDVAAARIFLEESGGCFLTYKKTPYVYPSKLFVAAFRSPILWKEIFEYLPRIIKEKITTPFS